MTKPAISLGGSVIQALRPDTNEPVSASGVDATATAIPAKVSVVRVVGTVFAGTNPTLHARINNVATTSDMPLIQDTVEYFKVFEGDVLHFIMSGTTPTALANVTLLR